MKAPSERHLEDWIVDNQNALGPFDSGLFTIVGRQVRVPSGIIDLLALNLDELCVIELKKGVLGSRELSQILRYMNDLRQIWSIATLGLPDPDPPVLSLLGGSFGPLKPQVRGILVGHGMEKWAYESARGAQVDVYQYDYDGEDYSLEWLTRSIPHETKYEYAYGFIGDAMRRAYMRRLQCYHSPEEIAAMAVVGSWPWRTPEEW